MVDIMLELLQESLANAQIVNRGDYHYFIHPISDGVPSLDPQLVDEVSDHILDVADMDVDKILTVEAMGIPVATAISLKSGVPMAIVRKRRYGLDGEVSLSQSTGYSKGELYINDIKEGERVLVVDDVISTGGTLKALLEAVGNMGAVICGIFVVIQRGDGLSKLRDYGFDVNTLVSIDVGPDGVSVKEVCGEPV